MIQYFPIVTGSLTVLGNINVSGSITTSGSITISGSITSASFATSASNATNAISASYANNLTVAGTLTAQTIVVQTVTSSVIYSSGSNVFGNNIANTQVLTGSVTVTGSLAVVTNGTEFQVTSTGVKMGNIIGDTHSITGSVGISGSLSVGSGSFPQTFAVKISGSAYNGTNVWFQDGSPTDGISFGGNGNNSYKTLNTYGGALYLNQSTQNGLVVGGITAIGTTSTSSEGNLFLGGLNATEGGQLVLQKGTSQVSASHLDNYSNQFRIMSGTDTASSTVRFAVDMTNGTTNIYGTLNLPNVSIRTNSISSIGTSFTTIGASQTYANLFWIRFNDSGGTTDYALVGAIWYPGQANVIASTNNGGHGVTFQMSGNSLQMKCASGTVGPVIIHQIGD